MTQAACIAVRSAISDGDRPFVTTVGALVAALAVDRAAGLVGDVGVFGPFGVLRVADELRVAGVLAVDENSGGDTCADVRVAADVGELARLLVTAEEAALDPVDAGVPPPTPADDAVLTTDGGAVRVVGPAAVDVQEPSRTAAPIDHATSTLLRRLSMIDPHCRSGENTGRIKTRPRSSTGQTDALLPGRDELRSGNSGGLHARCAQTGADIGAEIIEGVQTWQRTLSFSPAPTTRSRCWPTPDA